MLLAVDLGNTNVTLGVFSGRELVHTFRIESRRERTADEYAVLLQQLLTLHKVPHAALERAVLASVVPSLTDVFVSAVRLAFHRETLVVSHGVNLGISVALARPEEVGVDRIVNVVAARDLALREAGASDSTAVLGRGTIVIDLGTATKLDCLSPAGEFVGGIIAPGLRVSFDALIARGAKLPPVPLVAPQHVLGKNTLECLQSGIIYGHASLVDGLVARLRAELPFACDVLATGGLAPAVAQQTQCMTRLEPDLTLRGLYILHSLNPAPGTSFQIV